MYIHFTLTLSNLLDGIPIGAMLILKQLPGTAPPILIETYIIQNAYTNRLPFRTSNDLRQDYHIIYVFHDIILSHSQTLDAAIYILQFAIQFGGYNYKNHLIIYLSSQINQREIYYHVLDDNNEYVLTDLTMQHY